MPRIRDERVINGKLYIRRCIRRDFEAYLNDGRTYQYAITKLIERYGYAESTLYQMIKRLGKYKD